MQKTQPKVLENFLLTNDCPASQWVMMIVEPFFQISEKGEFNLVDKKEIDVQRLSHAISELVGRPIEKILFISRESEIIQKQNESLIKDKLPDLVFEKNKKFVSTKFNKKLCIAFMESLCVHLSCSLMTSLQKKNLDAFVNDIWPGITMNLFLFVESVIKNEDKNVHILKSILEFQQICFILGESQHSNEWLVITK